MEQSRILRKFIYEDAGITKVVKGYILREEEFTYALEAFGSGEKIVLGKRSIIKIHDAEA